MKLTERILASIVLISYMLELLHVAGFHAVFIVSTAVLSQLYFYLGFFILNEIPFRRMFRPGESESEGTGILIMTILFGFSSSFLLVGLIFKANDWPGGDFMVLLGLISNIVMTIIAFVIRRKKKITPLKNILIRGSVLTVIGLLLMLS